MAPSHNISLRSSSSHNEPSQSPSRLQTPHVFSESPSNDGNRRHAAPPGSEESTASTLVSAATTAARDRVVSSYHRLCGHSGCNCSDDGKCEHGVLSPRAASAHGERDDLTHRGSASYGGKFDSRGGDLIHGVFGDAITDGLLCEGRGREGNNADEQGIKHTSTTEWLAKRHHVRGRRKMYVQLNKVRQISREYDIKIK